MHCSVSPAKFFDRNQHWGSLHAAEHCTKTAKHVYSSVTGVLLASYLLMHLGNHFSRDHLQTRGAWQTCFSFDWLLERVGGSWAKVMHTLPWTVWVTKALLAGLCTYAGLEFGLTRPFWHWQGAQPLHYGLFTLPQGGMGKFLLQITTIFCKILFRGEISSHLRKNTKY